MLWHNYGKLPIGNRSDIEHVPIDRLAAFYQKYYQPDNALLTVAGQVRRGEGAGTGSWQRSARFRSRTRILDQTYTRSRRRMASAT